MNPLTQIKNTQKASKLEIAAGFSESASWHARFKHSAYVFAGGLPYDLTEGDLLAIFAQYGEIVDVNLVRDRDTGKSRGFAFIAYEDQRSTNLAVDNLSGARVVGRTIRVEHVDNYKIKRAEVEGRPVSDSEDEEGVDEDAERRVLAEAEAEGATVERLPQSEAGLGRPGPAAAAGDIWAAPGSVFALLTLPEPPPRASGAAPAAVNGHKAHKEVKEKKDKKENKQQDKKQKKDKEKKHKEDKAHTDRGAPTTRGGSASPALQQRGGQDSAAPSQRAVGPARPPGVGPSRPPTTMQSGPRDRQAAAAQPSSRAGEATGDGARDGRGPGDRQQEHSRSGTRHSGHDRGGGRDRSRSRGRGRDSVREQAGQGADRYGSREGRKGSDRHDTDRAERRRSSERHRSRSRDHHRR